MGKISVGIAGAIGVLIGILIAPRKGSETRERIVQRSKVPIQQAARTVASRAGETLKPVARVVGERVPMIGKDRDGASVEEPEGEAGAESAAAREDERDDATAGGGARSGRAGAHS